LGFLIGAPADRPLAEEEPSLLAAAPPEEIERDAERLRPDLQAAALRAEALRLLALEPLLRMVPTLDLQGIYRGTNEAGLSGNDTDWNVAATLTWEVFDGGVRYAQAAARRAEYREASLAADQLRRLIGQEIRTARADLDTSHAALEQARVRARVAQQNAEEVRVRFGEGLATGLEQADAVVSAFEAEAELARQRFALRLAELSLLRSAGRWPSISPPPPAPVPPTSDSSNAP
ncbi:MAG: TolC family protein, partial [Thermoanaerobaculia bacterium]